MWQIAADFGGPIVAVGLALIGVIRVDERNKNRVDTLEKSLVDHKEQDDQTFRAINESLGETNIALRKMSHSLGVVEGWVKAQGPHE